MKPTKILIPLFYDYYLFDYFRYLIPQLLEDNHQVHIITADKRVVDTYAKLDSRIRIAKLPLLLVFLINRYSKPFYRLCFWVIGWMWSLLCRCRFDFTIVPTDDKPLWYMLARCLPSMTCHTTTNFINIDVEKNRTDKKMARLQKTRIYKVLSFIDKVFAKNFFCRLDGKIIYSKPIELIIDRIFGFWSQCFMLGFSDVNYLTVMGHKNKENYVACGIDAAKITVTGSPCYDVLHQLKASFSEQCARDFLEKLAIKPNQKVFSFFLSPSNFTQVQYDEVISVITCIQDKLKDAYFVLKFHPKIHKAVPPWFADGLDQMGCNYQLITDFLGDEFNAKLILSSYCIVQKQSTVGYIAMLFKTPILSYNLYDTDYEDDMYKMLDASFHAENVAQLECAVDRLTQATALAELRQKQAIACHNFCIETASANQRIANIITNHFMTQKTKAVDSEV